MQQMRVHNELNQKYLNTSTLCIMWLWLDITKSETCRMKMAGKHTKRRKNSLGARHNSKWSVNFRRQIKANRHKNIK